MADEYTDSKVDYLSLRLCSDVVPYVRIVFDQEFPQLSIATAAFLNAIGWDRRATSNASLMLTLEMPNIEWDYAKRSST